ncbi:hypothetical protein AB35_4710 [Escherichia coli 2-474-04_S1_C2]|nr:hypothetical protein AC04_5071 [Escherichia coli 3-105-05_S3_C1]KDT41439.1 hypothetical protein AC32_5062 [Escherichia coli 3-105-05_S3_C2]KDY99312.1 hypothetical protein AB35_4710 [Escherichia coli 2-474-04_S1_C2]
MVKCSGKVPISFIPHKREMVAIKFLLWDLAMGTSPKFVLGIVFNGVTGVGLKS